MFLCRAPLTLACPACSSSGRTFYNTPVSWISCSSRSSWLLWLVDDEGCQKRCYCYFFPMRAYVWIIAVCIKIKTFVYLITFNFFVPLISESPTQFWIFLVAAIASDFHFISTYRCYDGSNPYSPCSALTLYHCRPVAHCYCRHLGVHGLIRRKMLLVEEACPLRLDWIHQGHP